MTNTFLAADMLYYLILGVILINECISFWFWSKWKEMQIIYGHLEYLKQLACASLCHL